MKVPRGATARGSGTGSGALTLPGPGKGHRLNGQLPSKYSPSDLSTCKRSITIFLSSESQDPVQGGRLFPGAGIGSPSLPYCALLMTGEPLDAEVVKIIALSVTNWESPGFKRAIWFTAGPATSAGF
ncbi:unnamed protein product [Pleuronectes platessa]|uniref:Uncharacterized protein n=1 Tax=Pleuronectes platessa TaxID=8262 RepID=A0A9N7UDG4_PLEPL|nr:unnamed protein product [Pleuronectes platessa]